MPSQDWQLKLRQLIEWAHCSIHREAQAVKGMS